MQKFRKLIFLNLFLFVSALSWAQSNITQGEFWLGYNGNIKLSKNWGIWTDLQYVTTSFAAIRIGATRTIYESHKGTIGYGRVYASTSFADKLIRDEHRPWAQLLGKFELSKRLSYNYRLRYDARFRKEIIGETILDSYIFYNRFRWQSDFRFKIKDLGSGKSFHVDLADELLVNAGKQVKNGIDQNRFYAFLGYTTPAVTILAGYDWRFIPQANGININRHGITVWVTHSIHSKNK